LRLNYFLSPRTYVHVLTDLIAEWDRFAEGEKLYDGQRYLAQSLVGFQRHRAVYERMECIYMGKFLLTQLRRATASPSAL
jgi:hypothetical protein